MTISVVGCYWVVHGKTVVPRDFCWVWNACPNNALFELRKPGQAREILKKRHPTPTSTACRGGRGTGYRVPKPRRAYLPLGRQPFRLRFVALFGNLYRQWFWETDHMVFAQVHVEPPALQRCGHLQLYLLFGECTNMGKEVGVPRM